MATWRYAWGGRVGGLRLSSAYFMGLFQPERGIVVTEVNQRRSSVHPATGQAAIRK